MDGEGDVIGDIFRSFENLNVTKDTVSLYFQFEALKTDNLTFSLSSKLAHRRLRWKLNFQFYKYLWSPKVQRGRKSVGEKFYHDKIKKNLFTTKIYLVVSSETKELAEGKAKAVFNNYKVFSKFPFNKFVLKIHKIIPTLKNTHTINTNALRSMQLTVEEITQLFHFPANPKTETSLLTVKAKKLALPVMIPSFDYTVSETGEVVPKSYPDNINIVGISDYRSITVPIGIYDEDRLRHVYVIGKTGTGKSKFLLNLMINDIVQGKGIGIIDPHGDTIDELMMHIPEGRKNEVIIFDPTDEEFPFCMNPLDVQANESKQILAKGFIDIFEKFFGANWNSKLEHVLRMLFLALLDKPDATLYDMIRALTDKDFRYEMINYIGDDVVRNFRTNEFAGWSQQFNTEAIMPILNKVGQLLSIDIIKNIFASPESKLDFRQVMDEKKILLIRLPKGKLQSEVMGFLGAMFVTKIFQTAMGRANLDKSQRIPFFLYIDEFQNFATKTFNEILSEARKYGLSLAVAHQFMSQIPRDISDSLFGNVGTLVSFRVSAEDAEEMK
ncbi:MAG: type IV secretion system DNA-binding domain-containing protein, partial [Candidatus Peribacteria bacterium]|nr:type IV secretion system DNA-binding domain-containing protein [Candidatus Peribacteria bacterium]